MNYILALISLTQIFSSPCENPSLSFDSNRSEYEEGDMLTPEDQVISFPVCWGNEDYNIGDTFSLSQLNGNENGGEYKVTLMSLNATW